MKDRIKELRKKLNLTQQEFADKIGIKRNSYANYETGRNIPLDAIIISICREFNVNEHWLRTGEGKIFNPPPNSALDALAEDYKLSESAYVMVEKFVKLKPNAQEMIYNYIREVATALQSENTPAPASITAAPGRLISYYYKNASAGTGQLIIDNLPEKDIEIPDLPKYQSASYAIGVNGSSMEPTYHDGDILLVEATQELHIGDIGIFQVRDECYVKRLGESELISLNPGYENIPLDESARTLGKVIGKL